MNSLMDYWQRGFTLDFSDNWGALSWAQRTAWRAGCRSYKHRVRTTLRAAGLIR